MAAGQEGLLHMPGMVNNSKGQPSLGGRHRDGLQDLGMLCPCWLGAGPGVRCSVRWAGLRCAHSSPHCSWIPKPGLIW